MSQRKASNSSNLLTKSKKIQKEPKPERQKPVKTDEKPPKKYKTFKDVKEEILEAIRLYFAFCNLLSSEVYAELCDLDQEDFDLMLNVIIPDYDESFTAGDILDLRRWRRKAKDWFKKDGAPDARGAPLIPHHLKESFKDHLKKAFLLKEIQDKSFADLRSKVLGILSKMGIQNIENNSCSKRWWYDYLPENKEIEALWEKLPKLSNKASKRGGISETPGILTENTSTIAEESSAYQNIFESSPKEEMPANSLFADSPFYNSDEGYGQNLPQSPEINILPPVEFSVDSFFACLEFGNFQVPKEPFDTYCNE